MEANTSTNGRSNGSAHANGVRHRDRHEETETVQIHVDGQAVSAQAGEPLGKVLKRLDAPVPQVCYHESLGPVQTCDTCIVRIDGSLGRACGVAVEAGMRVVTQGDRQAAAARTEAVQRMIETHELYCTLCDYNNGDCEVHEAPKMAGLNHQKYDFKPSRHAVDDSNPFYRYDPNQCIKCGRCVEACQDVQVTETLSIDWDAVDPRVEWDDGRKINDSSCVSCGHCVTVCPCNALMEKSMLGEAGHFTKAGQEVREPAIRLVKDAEEQTGLTPLFATSDAEAKMREQTIKKTKTVCTYCGVGCSFDVWTKGRDILKIQPQPEAPANGISTCIKGKFAWDFVNSDERLTAPLLRSEDADGEERFREASWDKALTRTAERLREIADEHGPDSVAFISSSKTTNEEAYLVQKMARAVFGTNNVDNCARYCQSPASKGLSRTVGIGADAGTMADMEKADLVLFLGTNTNTSHPVLAAHLKRRQKLFGQEHIVSDIREHEMARRADTFLRPEPGTDLVWLNAAAKHILDNDLHDSDFIEARVNDFDDYRESLDDFTLDFAEERTGLPAETIKDVAERIARAERVCGLWAMGITQHVNGADTCTAICNLLLLTGNFGKPGTGGYPLRGHNNVQGASDFGALYTQLPGYHPVSEDAEARARCAEAWGVDELPTSEGLNNRTMLDAIHDGDLKALFVIGEELSLVDANIHYVQEALEKLDFFVVQDIFFSTTAEFADAVLAASPSLEKDGTFVNTERRIQRLNRALDPLGESRPDWEILTDLAARLGHDWGYEHPSEIMDEVAGCTPEFAGASYDRLEGYDSLIWPVEADGTDTPLLYTEAFHFPDGKARFFPVEWTEPTDQPDEEYDLHLNNGRVLEHFHEGNLTYKTPGTAQKVEDAFVEVSPALAEERGLAEGDWVTLTSRRGTVETRVVISDEVTGGQLYMPVNSSEERVNVLSSNEHDPVVDTPAYKEVAVTMEPTGEKGSSPVPHTNPKYGNPQPQIGVQVEKKWAREDYSFPGGNG